VSSTRARRLRAPRALAAIIVAVFLCAVLGLHAIVTAHIGAAGTAHLSGNGDSVPPSVTDGGPVIEASNSGVISRTLKAKTIALTFDDGPDATWTPKVLAVLREYGINATFFMVGARITDNPTVARAVVADGNEVGIHTFTHSDMAAISKERRKLEYAESELALAGAVGETTPLLRFPYSSTALAIDDTYWSIMKEAGDLGYVTVVTDLDSEDWARPGVSKIVKNATPADGKSGVILFHDAGGSRTETIAALKILIPKLLAEGYTFSTVSNAVTSTSTAGDASTGDDKAAATERVAGLGLIAVVRVADWIVTGLTWLLIVAGALALARTALVLVLAGRHRRRHRALDPGREPVTAPVSVLVPAYNEAAGIVASVRSLATGDHPGDVEVIVVDDGSTDGTADLVDAMVAREGLTNVRVVRTTNKGKPAALNTGLALATSELIVMVDGDTVFRPDSIRKLVAPFDDPRVGAVAGNVRIGNARGLLGRWQEMEYTTGFNLDRRAYELLGCIPTVPGAIGAFRRQALRSVGGVSGATLAEDTDLTMAVTRAGWRVVYAEHAKAWTEAPSSIRQLYAQRYRWSYGTLQAMWKHRRAIRDRGPAGRFGRVGLPLLFLFGVVLPLLAPLVDIFAVYGLVAYDPALTAGAWLAMLGLQAATTAYAFWLEGEPTGRTLRALVALPLQQFVYRQIMYVVLARAIASAVTGARLRWQKLRRSGDVVVPGSVPAVPVALTVQRVEVPEFTGRANLSIVRDDGTVPPPDARQPVRRGTAAGAPVVVRIERRRGGRAFRR
jgi:cellulose synthase/poly-beta-1,6-N-acetylglucosamine synthase-like glycosyltransferase/peptidoglycan/xylan/chitin deacetylase (PgdA/CDA1 family)